MRVSVAICTWNRAKLLDHTLNVMQSIRVPGNVEWELLVVNNNCADETDQVLSRHSDALPIRRLFEPNPGLSNARNCAIAHATGDLILWTDDDVLVDENWLAEYVLAADNWPDAVFFGGTVDPWFESTSAAWVQRNLATFQGAFAIRQLGPDVRKMAEDERPFGANMAFRKEVLQKRAFDTRLGRCESNMLSGEDVAMIEQLRQRGQHGVWVGTARVRHFVPSSRTTEKYIWSYFHGLGRTAVLKNGAPRGLTLGIWPLRTLRKYATATVRRSIFGLTRGRRWATAFRLAARAKGTLDEVRNQNRPQHHNQKPELLRESISP
jgi:glycosyltransferase involved in cell wall biosynthesis